MEKEKQRKKSSLGIVKRIKQDDKSTLKTECSRNKLCKPLSTGITTALENEKNIPIEERKKESDVKDVEQCINTSNVKEKDNEEQTCPSDNVLALDKQSDENGCDHSFKVTEPNLCVGQTETGTPDVVQKNHTDSKRKSFKKRKELDLLFDVDGPPSKRKLVQRKRLSSTVKKTILGKRIILKSKRPIKNMKRFNEDGAVKKKLCTATNKKTIRRPVDLSTQVKTRGKKNRYWYLFARRDRKGNMPKMLSKPEDDDLHYYEWYRQRHLAQGYPKSTKTKKRQSYGKHKGGSPKGLKNKENSNLKDNRKVPKLILKLPPGTLPMEPKYETATFVNRNTVTQQNNGDCPLHDLCKSCSVVLVDFSKCLPEPNQIPKEKKNSTKLFHRSDIIAYYKSNTPQAISTKIQSSQIDSKASSLERQCKWNIPDLLQHTVNIQDDKQSITEGSECKTDISVNEQNNELGYKKEYPQDNFHEHICDSFISETVSGQQVSNIEDRQCQKTSRILRCQFCSFVEVDDKLIKQHVKEAHKEKMCYNCPLCNVSFFSNLESVEEHITKWHYQSELNISIKFGYYEIKGSLDKISVGKLLPKKQTVGYTTTRFAVSRLPKAKKSFPRSKLQGTVSSKNFHNENLHESFIAEGKIEKEKHSQSDITNKQLISPQNTASEKIRVSIGNMKDALTEVTVAEKLPSGIARIEAKGAKDNDRVQLSTSNKDLILRKSTQSTKGDMDTLPLERRNEITENYVYRSKQESAVELTQKKIEDHSSRASNICITEDCSSDEDDLAVEAFSVFNLKSPPFQVFFDKPKWSDQSVQSIFTQSLVQYKQFQAKPPEVKSNMTQFHSVPTKDKNNSDYLVHNQEASHFKYTKNAGATAAANKIIQKCARTLSCPYCTYKCVEMEVLHNHILTHEPNVKWTCPYCPMSNQMTKSVVEKHIKMCHPGALVIYIPFGIHLQGTSW